MTGQVEPFLPLSDKIFKYLLSYSAVLFMVCLVVALLVAIIIYRIILNTVLSYTSLTRFFGSTIVSITSAVINLIVILLLSQFYSWLSVKLTDLEYRRTDTEYENSLTIKMYCFQFVNFYGSLFYIAFFKGKYEIFIFLLFVFFQLNQKIILRNLSENLSSEYKFEEPVSNKNHH